VQFSDPHQAVGFDEMHSNDHGLGGKHLFPEIKHQIQLLGHRSVEMADTEYIDFLLCIVPKLITKLE
jgi:hypothetical protein